MLQNLFLKANTKFYLRSIISSNLKKAFTSVKLEMDDKPVEKSMKQKLETGLNPMHLQIINESYMHNVPKDSETHFKVVVVSEKFENMSLLNRHRMVNSLLSHELSNGVHALSIVAKTPSQWNFNEEIKPSPKCLGGFGK